MRKIIHVDMDAFFVSVEIRDNPDLAGHPVAVGGSSEQRGVIATCNYIAREFGVHSALSTAIAKRRCPHLIVVKGRMPVYKEISQHIRSIFSRYTSKIEPLSLDEAYLDVTDSHAFGGSATLIAEQIRTDIFVETGLTASAGIAPIKFLAKVASDINKPNGQCVISPAEVDAFIDTMPLSHIPGVGKVTNNKLADLGFVYGRDVKASSQEHLVRLLGRFGGVLWRRCNGLDEREVKPRGERKSVGVERTFATDIHEVEEMLRVLIEQLAPELTRRGQRYLDERRVEKLIVKVKFSHFEQTTAETRCSGLSLSLMQELLNRALVRHQGCSVRLLGLAFGVSVESAEQQLDLFY